VRAMDVVTGSFGIGDGESTEGISEVEA
jgi:hypothetical protein